jgi:Mg-chelatase subunit ChlI
MAILEKHIEFETDPVAFREQALEKELTLSERVATARERVDSVEYSRRDLLTIANLTSSLQVDGHRADLVILKTARAHAAYEGRRMVSDRDILLAAELALPHRFKRGPFQETTVSIQELESRLEQASQEAEQGESGEPDDSEVTDGKKKTLTS